MRLTSVKGFVVRLAEAARVSNPLAYVTGALLVAFAFAGACLTTSAEDGAPEAALAITLRPERGLLEWYFKERKLLTYAFSTNQFKPFVRELRTLRGDDVLRDAPADHLHHHGLMYAIRVNGVNFWEETSQPGHERHVKLLAHRSGHSANGRPQASFTELIHWVPHGEHTLPDTSSAALLVERRTLRLTVDEAKDEVALAWHAEFEVGARAKGVTLHGSEYNGLGLRLPAAWDHVARHENSEDVPWPPGGKPGAVAARWGAVSCAVDGRTMQVALCARPRGQAGTNFFFAMTDPFTYLSATQGFDKVPFEYRAGEHFAIDYLVLAYGAARTPAEIEARYQAWTRELNER